MDSQAIAETMADLYARCAAAIENQLQHDHVPGDIVNVVFEQSAKVYMTQLINQRKGPAPRQTPQQRQPQQQQQGQYQRQPRTQVQCQSCGNNLTVNEKKYCDDNGTDYICWKCNH